MNLASPKQVVALLDSLGVKPNKTLGKNFLIDGNTLDGIVAAAELSPGSKVLEVGPGLGSLTERMLPKCASLVAIEKDEKLAQFLIGKFGNSEIRKSQDTNESPLPNFQISKFPNFVNADALECGIQEIFASGRADTLVSNLPYSVGTRVVVEASLGEVPPRSMTLLLQKEVADRFAAAPRTNDYGAVSVWLQTLYDVRVVHKVPPSCFFPPPDVVSAVVTLRLRGKTPPRAAFLKLHALSKTAFLNRRKQMASSMRGASGGLARDADSIRAALAKCGAAPAARPEEINVAQWAALSEMW